MTVTRDDVEQALWRWTGWKADQRSVDSVMSVIDQVIGEPAPDGRAEDLIAEARNEAAQIVQSARDEAAALHAETLRLSERPPADLTPVRRGAVPLDVFRDPDGVLWLRLGGHAEAATGDLERTRRCTRCRGVKTIERFSPDVNSRGGRRALCRDCENAARRARAAAKAKVSQEVGP